MTEEHVKIAIAVLKAYCNGTLATDLCDELDDAIENAWKAYVSEHADELNDE